jgi:hypothetical protein
MSLERANAADGSTEEALLGDVIHEREEDRRGRQKLAGELTMIFHAFDRLANLMRVYPKRHPLVDALTEQVAGIVNDLLADQGVVRMTLHAAEIKLEGQDVCFSRDLTERDDYIWYEPYADGLVWFSLEPGLTTKELMNFIDVIVRVNAGNLGEDDDTTTLLWELEGEHIDFESLEGFVDGGIIDDLGCTEPEAVDHVVDLALKPDEDNPLLGSMFVHSMKSDDLDIFTRMHLQTADKMSMPRMADDDISYAFGIDKAAMRKLLDEWGSGLNLEYRLIETLLSIIRTQPKSSAGERASAIITQVTMQLLDKEEIHGVVSILKLLHARRKLLEMAQADPLAELVERLTAPFQLEATLNLFEKEPSKRDDIATMLGLLSPLKVQTHLLKVLSREGQVANEETLVTVLRQVTTPETEMALTSGEQLGSTPYLRRMLFGLSRFEDSAAWEPATRLVRAGLGHADDEIKMLAMAVDHPFVSSGSAAQAFLVPLSLEGGTEVRQRALALLAKFHRALFLKSVKENLLEGKFSGRSHGEVRFLMRTYIEHVPDAPVQLRQMVDVSGVFNEEAREFAKLAAMTLIEHKDDGVAEILRARAGSLWSSPTLRKQYKEILETTGLGLDAPAEEAPGAGGEA